MAGLAARARRPLTAYARRAGMWIAVHRAPLARALTLAALVCMALSAYAFRPQPRSLVHYRPTLGPEDYYHPLAPWLAGLGALLMLGALALRPLTTPRQTPARLDALAPGWAWLLVAPGALLLLAVAEANGQWMGLVWLDTMRPHWQLAALLGGAALLALGLGGLPRGSARAPTPQTPDVRMEQRAWHSALDRPAVEWAAVLLLAAVAVGVRLWALGDSLRVMVDEGHFALGVTYFWAFPDVNLLEPMPTSASFPFMFSYGQAGATALLGRNFLGLRAFSALLGGMTVPALYLLARYLYDRRTATVAALALLTFPPHLQYSRLGLNNIADPLFGTLALGLLALALRSARRIHYVWAGVALGGTQYFYEGGRLLYPALAMLWLAGGFLLWRPRPSPRGVILGALACALVALPIYYTLLATGFPLFDRLDKTELADYYWEREREPDTLATRIAHLRHAALHIVNAPENTTFHYYLYYGGHRPLLLAWTVPLFLLGLVAAAALWRSPGALPLPWILGTLLGNARLIESAVSARYVVAFPALALLIALGLRVTLDRLWPARPTGRLVITLALGVALAIGQGAYYFGTHLDVFNQEVRAHVQYDVDDALLRARDFPPSTQLHVVAEKSLPEPDAQRLMNFLADDLSVRGVAPAEFTSTYLQNLPREVDHAFFVPADSAALALLVARFGERPLEGASSPAVPAAKTLWLYYLPKDSDQLSAVSSQPREDVGG